jgi:hypothetical protein
MIHDAGSMMHDAGSMMHDAGSMMHDAGFMMQACEILSPHPIPLPRGERIEVRGIANSDFHSSWCPEEA